MRRERRRESAGPAARARLRVMREYFPAILSREEGWGVAYHVAVCVRLQADATHA